MVRSTRRNNDRGRVGPMGLMVASACMLAAAVAVFFTTDARMLRLSELHTPQAEALSCADDSTAPSDEPVAWCADPSSPQCLPALPTHAAFDLHDVQPGSLVAVFPLPRARNLLPSTPWRRSREERAPALARRDRLERPPRV
jgi:hypothetical protein